LDNNTAQFVRNPDFIFRKVVEETILVPVYQNVADMEAIYTLNELGAFIWGHMAEPVDKSALEKAILNAFDVDHKTVHEDLVIFLDELKEIGAIKKVRP